MAESLDIFSFPLYGKRLIEASAGTGKTFTLAALYVRLILGHSADAGQSSRFFLPPDILVVTFTEAATQELRERIRERLNQAARFFRTSTLEADAFLKQIRDAYPPEQWAGCARRLEVAANWMDEAAIYTIHGWCNRMLQQHAFDSGNLFRQSVNNDEAELLLEIVRDYWREHFYPLSANSLAALPLANSPEAFAKTVIPLLNEWEAVNSLVSQNQNDSLISILTEHQDWLSQGREQEDSARQAWSEEVEAIELLFSTAIEEHWLNGNSYPAKKLNTELERLSHWSKNQLSLDSKTLLKFGYKKLTAALVKNHQNKAEHFKFEVFRQIDELLGHLEKPPATLANIALHACKWIHARYEAEKQKQASMTFDDMLTRLNNALQSDQGARLAEVMRNQFPVAMIDEFQDTDPTQYQIFSKLYPECADQHYACVLIGDPKQAIYSFRGADIFTYLKAHQETQGQHYTLDTNFRSTTALVAAINQVFTHADQQTSGAFRFKRQQSNPLPFHAVKAHGREDEWQLVGLDAPAMTLWLWQGENTVGQNEYYSSMAECTASEIVRLLNLAQTGQAGFNSKSTQNFRALQPADIAILVRTGKEARIVRSALARRRLRSVYLSERDSIYATHEALDLLYWLRALAEPRNESKVRAAISTTTLAWSSQQLHALTVDEEAWEQQLENFQSYHICWQQEGILPALRKMINDFGLAHRLKQNNEGERQLTNILHLAELLQQASSQMEGEHALIRHLSEKIEDVGNQSGDESILRLESDANLIKIITIHKSKGLEYPLVFLPFICSYREVSSQSTSFYRFHDDQGQPKIDLSKDDGNRQTSDAERLQEDIRLLYVALTRARYACWLGIAPITQGNNKSTQLFKTAFGALLNCEPKMPVSELPTRLEQAKGSCAAIVITPLPEISDLPFTDNRINEQFDTARSMSAPVVNNWWIASYSALLPDSHSRLMEIENSHEDQHQDEAERNPDPLPSLPSGLEVLPRGAGPGVLIHALLEECAQLGFAKVHADKTLMQDLIIKHFDFDEWTDHHAILKQALLNWLSCPLLPHTDLSLSSLHDHSYQAELEFLIGIEHVDISAVDKLLMQHLFPGRERPPLFQGQINGLLKGFIDLVFMYDDRYYIADYKFNILGNSQSAYQTQELEATVLKKRYDLQCALYVLALHRLLKSRLGEHYAIKHHLGGGLYWFLRGADKGQLLIQPQAVLIDELDRLFSTGKS